METDERRTMLWWGACLVVAVAASLVAGGCGTGDPAAGPGPTEPASPTEPAPGPAPTEPAPSPADTEPAPPTGPDPALAGDWTADFLIELPGGWTVTGCDGDRRDLCVHRAGRVAGDVELLGYPLDGGEESADPAAVASARAEAFVGEFDRDRAAGCAGFTFVGDDVVAATVGGQPASRAGFTLTDASGRVVERVVNYFTVHDGVLWLVNVDAYAEEAGCLGPSEFDPSFLPEDLAAFEPYLDGLVASTPLPAGATP